MWQDFVRDEVMIERKYTRIAKLTLSDEESRVTDFGVNVQCPCHQIRSLHFCASKAYFG